MTPGFATSTRIDLNQIGEARNSMLGIKLDQVINNGIRVFKHLLAVCCILIAQQYNYPVVHVFCMELPDSTKQATL